MWGTAEGGAVPSFGHFYAFGESISAYVFDITPAAILTAET